MISHEDEAGRLARFAPQGEAEGLLAYALHRRALIGFRVEFQARQGRAPEAAEEVAFLIGEGAPERIEAYRAQARAMMVPPPQPAPAKSASRQRVPFWGQWVDAPLGPDGKPVPVNWRGLFWRLGILLLAVIATAVLLRALVTKA